MNQSEINQKISHIETIGTTIRILNDKPAENNAVKSYVSSVLGGIVENMAVDLRSEIGGKRK